MAGKTNALRLLERAGIKYKIYEYAVSDGKTDGVSVADKIGRPRETVFKTLITYGARGVYYVFVVPVEQELDLKAAAKAVLEKSVSMLNVSDIEKVTGYVKGGCSPVGMKKPYKTVIHESAAKYGEIVVSAGKIGLQMELSVSDLIKITGGVLGSIAAKN